MTFAELESVENNSFTNIRLKRLMEIDNSIDWHSIKKIFDSTYEAGKNKLGQPAYPPLMLFKCLLLQKWFRIDSDPELESQINDSRAFRKFLGLSSDIPSPDHSSFSRFRGRLSNEKLDKLKAERSAPGHLDKTGKPRKFSRDLESNWTVKNDKPYYGLKEHTSIDTNHGFILATVLSRASVHDTNYFQYCTLYSRYTKQKLKMVYADKGSMEKETEVF